MIFSILVGTAVPTKNLYFTHQLHCCDPSDLPWLPGGSGTLLASQESQSSTTGNGPEIHGSKRHIPLISYGEWKKSEAPVDTVGALSDVFIAVFVFISGFNRPINWWFFRWISRAHPQAAKSWSRGWQCAPPSASPHSPLDSPRSSTYKNPAEAAGFST